MSKRSAICTSFILCDQVIQDRHTGKSTLVGVFDRIFCQGFPAGAPLMSAFGRIVDLEGYHTVKIEIRDGEDALLCTVGPVEMNVGTARTSEVFLNAMGVVFPKPGKHQVQLLVDGELLSTVSLSVEPVGKVRI